jgi:hypothetical protein
METWVPALRSGTARRIASGTRTPNKKAPAGAFQILVT